MFEPFCFMDMFISIQCKWSNKNHFQLRHITNQTSFSSSRAVTSSVCDDVGLFDFRRRRTNSEHEAETLSLSVRREAAGLLWTATRSLSFSPVQTEHLNSLQILWHHVMTSSQEDSQWPHVRRWRWFLQQKWWKSKFPARNKQIKKTPEQQKEKAEMFNFVLFILPLYISFPFISCWKTQRRPAPQLNIRCVVVLVYAGFQLLLHDISDGNTVISLCGL